MSKRPMKSNEQFLKEFKEIHPDLEPLDKYSGDAVKLHIHCLLCDTVWEATPGNLLHGKTGCPKCSVSLRGKNSRKTDEQFNIDLKNKHPNMLALESYVTNKTKIYFYCTICKNVQLASPERVMLRDNGCVFCGKKKRSISLAKTDEEFREQLKKINPDIEALDKYVNNHTKIRVRCKLCNHIWKVTPHHLLDSKSGCPVCVKDSLEKPILDAFIKNKIVPEHNMLLDGSNYNGSCRPLFVDFVVITDKGKLAVEADGKQHFITIKDKEPLVEIQGRDRHKDKILKERGFILIRITSSPTKEWGFKNHIVLNKFIELLKEGSDGNGNLDLDVFRPYDFNMD